jgi:hypothetical protein
MRSKIIAIALLICPATVWAVPITINWSGEITEYHATPGSPVEPPLSSNAISGSITYDTDLLPTPDAGSTSEFLSFSGGDFISSSVQWAGGTFNPNLPGGLGFDTLQITNGLVDSFLVVDSSSVFDVGGRIALLQFNLIGLPNLFSGNIATADSVPNGAFMDGLSSFLDLNLIEGSGFDATYSIRNVNAQVASVPEPGMLSLLAIGLLTIALSRRKRTVRERT